MGEVILASTARQRAAESSAISPSEFAALCWAMQASADQLSAIAMKAAVHGGTERGRPQQEAYVTMMLGPLAAMDKLRRQLTQT